VTRSTSRAARATTQQIAASSDGTELSDVRVPEMMRGPELACRLPHLCPGLRTIFASGYADQTIRERGSRLSRCRRHPPERRAEARLVSWVNRWYG
jgi:hypothetical protein